MKPWMIWDIEREREKRERENEVARGLWLPLPEQPMGKRKVPRLMTSKRKRTKRPEPYEYTGVKLKAYRQGWWDGNESNYFPACTGAIQAAYDHGYEDGKKYGPRKGKPWTLPELLKGLAELKRKRKDTR